MVINNMESICTWLNLGKLDIVVTRESIFVSLRQMKGSNTSRAKPLRYWEHRGQSPKEASEISQLYRHISSSVCWVFMFIYNTLIIRKNYLKTLLAWHIGSMLLLCLLLVYLPVWMDAMEFVWVCSLLLQFVLHKNNI